MSLSPSDRDKLHRLLHDVRNGDLQTEDGAWLNAILLADEEARQLYVESVWLTGAVHWMLHGNPTQAPPTAELLPVEIPVPAPTRIPVAATRPALQHPVLRGLVTVATSVFRPALWMTFGGCAIYALYVVVLTWGMFDERPRVAQESSADGPEETAPARVTASENAAWSDTSQAVLDDSTSDQQPPIAIGKPLTLESGTVALKLKQGVKLLIEGPAEWTIDGDNQATLTHGKLLASVPPPAIGFAVITPTITVVDLGTEFGVTVDKQGGTRARVFKGEIRLQASGTRAHEGTHAGTSRRLTAGQAARIDTSGTITPIAPKFASAEEFIRPPQPAASVEGPSAPLELPNAYSQAVLKTRGLVGYWRLGEDGSEGLRDEVGAGPSQPLGRSGGTLARFHADDYRRPGALPGQKSYAIHFNGESYIEIDDRPELEGDWEGLTLAAWIQPDLWQAQSPDSTALLVGKWAPDAQGCAYGLFYQYTGKLTLAIGNGKRSDERLVGIGNVPIGFHAYRFVVGTWDKATGDCRLYVDGKADQAQYRQQTPIGLNPDPYMPLSIGAQIADKSRYFTGLMDEVSIFNRALTTDEVTQLYGLATAKTES